MAGVGADDQSAALEPGGDVGRGRGRAAELEIAGRWDQLPTALAQLAFKALALRDYRRDALLQTSLIGQRATRRGDPKGGHVLRQADRLDGPGHLGLPNEIADSGSRQAIALGERPHQYAVGRAENQRRQSLTADLVVG